MLGIHWSHDEEAFNTAIGAQLTDVQVETRAAMDLYKGKLRERGGGGPSWNRW